jgi:hypothetical protein
MSVGRRWRAIPFASLGPLSAFAGIVHVPAAGAETPPFSTEIRHGNTFYA